MRCKSHWLAEEDLCLIDIRRSELLPNGTNELKWLKPDIEQLKDELAHSRSETNEKLFLMELNFFSQVQEIDSRINTIMTQMESVIANILLFHNAAYYFSSPVSKVTQLDHDIYGTRQNEQRATTNSTKTT